MTPSRSVPARALTQALLLGAWLFAGTAHAIVTPQDGSHEVDRLASATALSAADVAAVEAALQSSVAWRTWSSSHPGWRVQWNLRTRTAHRLFGPGVRLAAAPTAATIESLARDFLAAQASLTGVQPEGLRLAGAEHRRGKWYVVFEQVEDGLPVRGGRADLRVGDGGEVMLFGADWHAGARVARTPSVAQDAALAAATRDLAARPTDVRGELVVVPEPRGTGFAYRLAHEVRFRTTTPPGDWVALVDAHSGDLLRRQNHVRWETLSGRVTAGVELATPFEPAVELPLRDLRFNVNSGTTEFGYTDPDGNYSVTTTATDTVSVRVRLSGRYGRVYNEQLGRITPAIDARMFPGTTRDFLWDDSNSRASERDGYYHALVAHETIKILDPPFTGVDYPMPIVVDIDDRDCNAFWDGIGINFFGESDRCSNTARIADVVYHEYAHGITDTQYRPLSPSGAMHEGFSDYYAATITDQPIIGRGFRGPGTFIRTVDNTNRWPEDATGEVHRDGLIIAGALWDLREALGRTYTDTLYHFARYGKSDNFDDYMLDVLVTDDDNADIYDGTPHFDAIVSAFSAHGIGDYSVQIDHEPEPDTEDPSKPLVLDATILSIFPLEAPSLVVHWSNDGGSNWTALALAPAAGVRAFTATIPAQTLETTVSYYYTAADTAGNSTVLPPSGAAAPFTFRVGADVTPPVVEHTPLADRPLAAPGWPVRAIVTDNLDRGLASVVVRWSRNSTALDQVSSLAPDALPRWSAALPVAGASLGDSVYYKLVATDSSAASNIASDPAAGHHAFRVVQGSANDLEADDAGLVSSGDWQWGVPTDAPAAFSGTHVWGTGLAGPYSNDLESLLETAPIDLGTWTRASLVFRHWVSTEFFYDGGQVQVSMDGGISWSFIEPSGGYPLGRVDALGTPGYTGDTIGWETAEFDLSRFLGQTLQLRWRFASDSGVVDRGWFLDDIEIVERQVLSVPLGVTAESGLDSRVPLFWAPPAGIDPDQPGTPLLGYHVYRGELPDLSDGVRLTASALTANSYEDPTAVNGVSYWYAVTALYAEGESPPSAPAGAQPYVAGYAADLASLYVGVPLGGATDTTIVFTNTGTGFLNVNLWPGDATDASIDDVRIAYEVQYPEAGAAAGTRGLSASQPPAASRWRREDVLQRLAEPTRKHPRMPLGEPSSGPAGALPYVRLYTDTQEGPGYVPDLRDLWVAETGGAGGSWIYFKIRGWQAWGNPLADFNTLIGIDTDTNRGTGDQGGADYYVLMGVFALTQIGVPAVIVTGSQDIVGVPPYLYFPVGADSLEVGFPIPYVGQPRRVVLSLLALAPNMQTPIDMMPDTRVMQTWMDPATLFASAPAGVPTPLTLAFPGNVPAGRYRGKLFLETNAPATPVATIPITYDFLVTAVDVHDLAAAQEDADVVVRWRTTREADVGAFRVHRSRDGGPFAPLAPDVAPAASRDYAFRDPEPEPGRYTYRIGEVAADGSVTLHGTTEVVVTRVAPRATFLDRAVPNPFNPTTTLRLGIATAGPAEVAVFDARGRKVRTLWQTEHAEPGFRRLVWDGRDAAGARVASGVYHARLIASGRTLVRRLTLVK